ncbi:hypothetical protein NBRC116494_24420 [Aurantivibrio plasticivorans]
MKKIILPLVTSIALFTLSQLVSAKCEDTVDMADSLRFDALHGNCEENDSSEPQVQTTTNTPDEVNSTASIPSPQDKAVQSAHLSESFSLAGGPLTAQTLLFQKLADKCPNGWEITRQWVDINNGQTSLNYGYRCLAVEH